MNTTLYLEERVNEFHTYLLELVRSQTSLLFLLGKVLLEIGSSGARFDGLQLLALELRQVGEDKVVQSGIVQEQHFDFLLLEVLKIRRLL